MQHSQLLKRCQVVEGAVGQGDKLVVLKIPARQSQSNRKTGTIQVLT